MVHTRNDYGVEGSVIADGATADGAIAGGVIAGGVIAGDVLFSAITEHLAAVPQLQLQHSSLAYSSSFLTDLTNMP
jgi:hypothetical protein